jgi:alpha-galactosidase
MWRTTDDLMPTWSSLLRTLDLQIELYPYSKPGHWNDPDMLQVGNGSLTHSENKAHIFLWAILNAPLMAGNDLRTMSDETLEVLTHKGVIAIDQDWGGSQGKLIKSAGDVQLWEKPMSTGNRAVVVLNRGEDLETFSLEAQYPEINQWKDVWSGDHINSSYVELAPHEAVLLLSC